MWRVGFLVCLIWAGCAVRKAEPIAQVERTVDPWIDDDGVTPIQFRVMTPAEWLHLHHPEVARAGGGSRRLMRQLRANYDAYVARSIAEQEVRVLTAAENRKRYRLRAAELPAD